ncbi:MAG TPA: SGNH/GDSL hydrolase family protein [Nitrospira sp.]
MALIGAPYTFGEGVTRTEETYAQVLEDTLNHRHQAVTVKTFNFGASAYSVKEMVTTLQYRTPDIQPDLVVMAIITSDFNLARTPTIDEEGYLVDRKSHRFSPPGSMIRRALRHIHLIYILREIGVRWFFPSPNVGQMISRGENPETYEYVRQFKKVAEEHGLSYVIVLLPRMRQRPWGLVPDELTRDRIAYIDLSSLKDEFTEEPYRASRFAPHPSAAVHHRIGEALADYVQRRPGFAQ